MLRSTIRVAALLLAVAIPVSVPLAARAAQPQPATPGAPGLGDPVFPQLGNGGYDVLQYVLDFDYQADTKLVNAKARIIAKATQRLSGFNLDSVGAQIHEVRVNGAVATHAQNGEELVVTAQPSLKRGRPFAVEVSYTADPRMVIPGRRISGWVKNDDGFAMAGQPDVAHMVFPCNDHPSDKARFLIRVTVPEGQGVIGVANGTLHGTKTTNGRTTYTYGSRDPIATELVQVAVGKYTVVNRQGPAGVPVRDVVPTDRLARLEPALALTPGQMEWVTRRLGPFPLETYGLLPVNNDRADAFDFTGLETQTLTLYRPKYLEQEESKIASHQMHELTHNWFGNSVSPRTWADLWLNEGHADLYGLEYRYERGWPDRLGITTLEGRMKHTYGLGDQWRAEAGPVARPNAANLFHNQRYLGGVLVLFALREKVGADTFDAIERTYLERHRNGVASTQDYIDLASEISGQDLGPFLTEWLYGTRTPPMPNHPDWTVAPVPASQPPGARLKTTTPTRDNSATL